LNVTKQNEEQRIITDTYRNLWRYHVLWIGSYMTSTVTSFGNPAYYSDRASDNADDFTKTLLIHYDNDESRTYGILMHEHIRYEQKYLLDIMSGDTVLAESTRAGSRSNAVSWARHMSVMNPYWNMQTWQQMLFEHVRLTELETLYEVRNRRPDPENTQAIEEQILGVGEYMASGIIKQFNI
jgi:hypothetical protein